MKHTPAILSLLALFSLSVTAEAGPRAREVVTICHERGYGADFMTPGNENSKTMKQVDDLFQSYSQRHIALDKEKQRSISVAHTERDTFRKHLQSLVEDICKRKKAGMDSYAAYMESEKKADLGQCNALEEVQQNYQNSSVNYAQFGKFIDDYLHQRKTELAFRRAANVNQKTIDAYIVDLQSRWKRDPTNTDLPRPEQELAILQKESKLLWSSKQSTAKEPEDTKTPIEPDGLFAGVLVQIYAEKEQAKFNAAALNASKIKLDAFVKKCGTIGPPLVQAKEGEMPTFDPTKPWGEAQPVAEQKATPDNSRATAVQQGPPAQQVTQTGPPPPAPPPPPPSASPSPSPSPAPTKVEEESFLSKNKGTIVVVGVGAAAVGGVLYYKNQQDKKAKREMEAIEAEAQAAADLQRRQEQSAGESSSSSSSSSEGAGQGERTGGTPATSATPPGSILIVTGVPSGAEVDSNISQLTVAIVDPKGILTSDSNTNVTLS